MLILAHSLRLATLNWDVGTTAIALLKQLKQQVTPLHVHVHIGQIKARNQRASHSQTR